MQGVDAGSTVESEGDELTVGTAKGNHLQLQDPAVSRHHCTFRISDEGIELRDLDSTNHTTLAGFRVASAYIGPGARVGLGNTALVVEPMEEEHCVALSESEAFGGLLGASEPMRRVFAVAERIASAPVNILIEGETGTGKGALAEAIHEASPRAAGPFVVVDCSALPGGLLESELFGAESGAFTGAERRRVGLLESAHGGTVFLDEIGELPLEAQPKLLRALENREVYRLGSSRPVALDFRLIAATNRDLRRAVNKGTFRADLLYRVNTVRIEMPALRDRREDIPLLVRYLHRRITGAEGTLPPEVVKSLQERDWPGNVRELRSAVERSALLGLTEEELVGLTPAPLQLSKASTSAATSEPDLSIPFQEAKRLVVDEFEQRYLRALLTAAGDNISQAARLASMDRGYLRKLLERHQLRTA